jgi:endogenous inhibitor of DNA gyrase (YacG/DUF329 family)
MSPPRDSGDAARLVEARCVYTECGRKFTYDPGDLKGSSFPFCSPRCKGADLGEWVNEVYRVPGMPDLRGLDDEEAEEAPKPKVDDEEE